MKLDPNIVIDRLGGVCAAARFFEIEPPSICDWRENGVPKARGMYLKLARPDVFAAASKPNPIKDGP